MPEMIFHPADLGLSYILLPLFFFSKDLNFWLAVISRIQCKLINNSCREHSNENMLFSCFHTMLNLIV